MKAGDDTAGFFCARSASVRATLQPLSRLTPAARTAAPLTAKTMLTAKPMANGIAVAMRHVLVPAGYRTATAGVKTRAGTRAKSAPIPAD